MRDALKYDMAVIGGGAAGLAAAIMANTVSSRTVLIEQRRLGGECTFTGCVPSKTLIHTARLLHDSRRASRFASTAQALEIDFPSIMRHVRTTRERIYQADDAPPNLEKRGIHVVSAKARFTGPHELEITPDVGASWTLQFRYATIATGSEPQTLQTTLPPLTNETLFEIDTLPRELVIAGAGSVGIEMAQAFARLGSQVTVVAPEARILPNDDEECAAVVQRALERENVRFLFGRSVREYRKEAGGRVVCVDDGSQLRADALLAAVGRKPRLEDLGLTQAGVRTTNGKIVYDKHCRTTARHIFVAGDVAGWYRFTHAGEHMSRIAVTNALFRLPAKLEERGMVWTTFTDPEIAHCGHTAAQLRERGTTFDVVHMPYQRIDRAVTDDATDGLINVLADRRGRVLGATVAGQRAGDLIAEWSVAVKKRLTLRDLSGVIHAYPTYALGGKRLADEWYASRLTAKIAPVIRTLFRYQSPV